MVDAKIVASIGKNFKVYNSL